MRGRAGCVLYSFDPPSGGLPHLRYGLNPTTNFVAAAGFGGTVDVTRATTQNELHVLWGTVDPEAGRNLITIGATTIDGAAIMAAIINQGFPYYDNLTNTYLRITGLPNFTSAVFSDSVAGNFEFALGVTTPLPAALPLFATGLGALGLFGWRRKRKAKALTAYFVCGRETLGRKR